MLIFVLPLLDNAGMVTPTENNSRNTNGLASRPGLTPWRPGQSGNPGGRPRNRGLPALVREITEDGATILKFLNDVMDGSVPKARVADRVAAARELGDRLWGKAVAAVELSGPGGGPLQHYDTSAMDGLTIDELRQLAGQREVLIDQRERMLRLLEAQRQAAPDENARATMDAADALSEGRK